MSKPNNISPPDSPFGVLCNIAQPRSFALKSTLNPSHVVGVGSLAVLCWLDCVQTTDACIYTQTCTTYI